MNDPGSTIAGILILAAAGLLFMLGGIPSSSPVDPRDRAFWEERLRTRHWISAMLAAVGLCAVGAGFFGRGPAWILFWGCAPLFLCGVFCFAMLDVLRTRRHFRTRLRQLKQQIQQATPSDQPPG